MIINHKLFIWKGLKSALPEALNKQALGSDQPKGGILYVHSTAVFDVFLCGETPINGMETIAALNIQEEAILEQFADGEWKYTAGWTHGPLQSDGRGNLQQTPKDNGGFTDNGMLRMYGRDFEG